MLALAAVACSGTAEDTDVQARSASVSPAAEPAAPAALPDRGVSAREVSGLWIFTHNSPDGGDALFSGVARIANGCLLIGDTVVVWRENQLDAVTEYIDAARAGESIELTLAGAELSAAVGNELPPIVTDRCASEALWFVQ